MIEAQLGGFVALLLLAAVVAALVQRTWVPYVSALAVVGLLAGLVIGAHPFPLTHALILFVVLPGLLFEASFNVRWSHLRDNLVGVMVLATVGVLVTAGVAALLVHIALGLSVATALLFGAIVAPTDPVAVTGVFARLRVPGRLATLVESESLINDGTGVILFTVTLAATGAGGLPWPAAVLDFLRLALGGAALGIVIGFGLSLITRLVDDQDIEVTLTALAAYGGYLVADRLGASGILAVVCAGLTMGNYGRPRGMSEQTQAAVTIFWRYVAFVLNSLIFVLIGLNVPWAGADGKFQLIAAAALILLVARAVTVYGLFGLLRPFGRSVNLRWQHLMVWSGLRGAVAVALLLSLGREYPEVQALAYGVVLVSILIQGMTIYPMARLVLPHSGGKGAP